MISKTDIDERVTIIYNKMDYSPFLDRIIADQGPFVKRQLIYAAMLSMEPRLGQFGHDYLSFRQILDKNNW